ncbi:MAG TPA: sel1 repeat family protein [Sulfurimonas sp.]|nr:sel1 repeat family protein [Sulfurimonas sp.]
MKIIEKGIMKKLLLVLLVLIVLSFTLYQKAANQRNAAAQYNLGMIYEKGQGVKQNYIKAAKLYQKAADQEHAGAQANLGFLYYYGQGVKHKS